MASMKLTFVTTRHTENVQNTLHKKLAIEKRSVIFGRGDELTKKVDGQTHTIDCTHLDTSISRIHASIRFSPAWFHQVPFEATFLKQYCLQPEFYKNNIWTLPEELLFCVYQFLKPRKMCILKDLNSSLGTHQKVRSLTLERGTVLSWGDNRSIVIIGIEEKSADQVLELCETLQQKGYLIKDKSTASQNYKQIQIPVLEMRVQKQPYLLIGDKSALFTIGRANTADIRINHTEISRKQAIINCQEGNWIVFDGNGEAESINGSWNRISQKVIFPGKIYEFKMGRTLIQLSLEEPVGATQESMSVNDSLQVVL